MGDDALRSAQSPVRPEADENHISLQEAALDLGVPVAALHLAIKDGTLICSHHYGRHLISRTDLESFRLRTQPTTQTATPPSPDHD